MTESALLSFYRGNGTDHAERTFDAIIAWDDRWLEMIHDYIQWLFPLPEPSRFSPDAPLLSAADQAVFRREPELQKRLIKALDRMLTFYGLSRSGDDISRGAEFVTRSKQWLTPANHNHLRLTRILLFLGHAGMKHIANSLYRCLSDIADHEGRQAVSPQTRAFWQNAILKNEGRS